MFGYMLEEQVDKDFTLARRRALLRRIGARLRRRNGAPNRLLCFDEIRSLSRAVGRVYRGTRTVPVAQIGGSVGRCSEFDRDFMPARASMEERWKRIDRAFWRGEDLPPVSLYKVGNFYFVLDGHHRVSVARYHGVEWIDADVTEFGARVWSCRRDKPRMREMMSLQLAEERRGEMLREAELSRRAKALRATCKGRDGRRSALVWEAKRHLGRLLKLLSALRNVG